MTEQITHLPEQMQKQIYADVHEAQQLYKQIKSALVNVNTTELSRLLGEVLENSTVLTYLHTKIPSFIETQQQIILSHQTKDEFATLWYKNIVIKNNANA